MDTISPPSVEIIEKEKVSYKYHKYEIVQVIVTGGVYFCIAPAVQTIFFKK